MHYLLYVTYFINVTHAYASGWPLFKTYWLKFRFGITGVKRFFSTKNAVTSSIRLTLPVPLAKGAVSSSFFTLSEYPTGSCILLVSSFFLSSFFFLSFFFLLSSFFLLATLQRLIASTCFDWFQPDLVIRTPDPWHLCHLTRVGSKVT